MTNEQKAEFEQRRLKVMRAYVKNDPKLRQFRRKRKRAVAASVLGSLVALGVALVLIKSFILAMEGQDGYARMVAPMMEGQSEGAVVARALGPDPVSAEIAALLRPLFRDAQTAAPAEGVTVPLNLSSAEIDPPQDAASRP